VTVNRIRMFALAALLCAGCDGGADASAGNPFQCVGLPTATCERILSDAQREFPGVPVVRADIRCTIAVCTDAKGEASIRVDFANGRMIEYGSAWEQAVPAPIRVPPVFNSPHPQPTSEP
jgi:hypothetical protein